MSSRVLEFSVWPVRKKGSNIGRCSCVERKTTAFHTTSSNADLVLPLLHARSGSDKSESKECKGQRSNLVVTFLTKSGSAKYKFPEICFRSLVFQESHLEKYLLCINSVKLPSALFPTFYLSIPFLPLRVVLSAVPTSAGVHVYTCTRTRNDKGDVPSASYM